MRRQRESINQIAKAAEAAPFAAYNRWDSSWYLLRDPRQCHGAIRLRHHLPMFRN
jgi:hypothetical protein